MQQIFYKYKEMQFRSVTRQTPKTQTLVLQIQRKHLNPWSGYFNS